MMKLKINLKADGKKHHRELPSLNSSNRINNQERKRKNRTNSRVSVTKATPKMLKKQLNNGLSISGLPSSNFSVNDLNVYSHTGNLFAL